MAFQGVLSEGIVIEDNSVKVNNAKFIVINCDKIGEFIVLSDYGAKMAFIFDKNLKEVIRFKAQCQSRMSGICFNSKGDVIVSDSGGKALQKFDGNGKFQKKIENKDYPFSWPCGLSTDKHDNIYAVDSQKCGVFKLSPEGDYESFFGGMGKMQNPFGGCVGPNGNTYVADSKNNRVLIYNQDGELVKEFGTERRPGNIAISSEGLVALTFWDNNISIIYSQEGAELYRLKPADKSPNLCPIGIAIDCNDRLYFCFEDNVKVYQLLLNLAG